MIIYRENFDEFHVCESTYGRPVKDGHDLLVPAIKLFLTGDHPVAEFGGVATGIMRFKNAVSSIRSQSEYVGDPTRNGDGYFKPLIDFDDGPFELTEKGINAREYEIEGSFDNPHTCIGNWIIKAESFELECEGVYDLKLIPGGCEYLNYRTIEEAMKQASTG